nr:MAG: capsid protein [Cressdnaviricota sp.]
MVYQKKYKYQSAIYRGARKAAQSAALGYASYRRVKNPVKNLNKAMTTLAIKKKKSIYQKATPEGTGGWVSSQFYTPRIMPRAYKVLNRSLPKNYYVINTAVRATTPIGLQGIFTPLSIWTKADVNAISQKITANNTNRFLCQASSAELLLTNQDIGNCKVILYDILARRDLSTSGNITTPAAAFLNSLADEGGLNTNALVVGTTPFSSDLFTQFFKVCKVTTVTLAQGQCHTHRVSFKVNKVIDGEYIQYEGNGFKGMTHFTMMVVHGLPYNDSVTKTTVSIGSTAIDIVSKIQYKYTWIQDVDTTYSVANTLPGSFAVNEDVMDIGTGAAAVDSTA